MNTFFGLNMFQILAVLTAVMTLLLLVDAFIGHYRSGFTRIVQYAPFITGGFLIICTIGIAVAPASSWLNTTLRIAGWLAMASGLIGFGFHHYYGMAKKPGGYKLFLHNLMYGAPQLAPMALTAMGFLGLVVAHGLNGSPGFAGINFDVLLFGFVAVTLFFTIVEAGILHYRGAFHNPLMYAPLTAPLLAVAASVWLASSPGNDLVKSILTVLLWLTLVAGFVGFGMHLRGQAKQFGGWKLWRFHLLEGPPISPPLFFSGLSAVGLTMIYL